MIKVRPLVGFASLRALNAFHTIMLGVKMLPPYQHEGYEEFYERIKACSEDDQKKIIKEGALFVELQKEELAALVSFCDDPNGVPYQASNIGNLNPAQLVDIIVAVCFEISKFKIDLISESEKKKLSWFSVDVRRVFAKRPDIHLEDALNIAFFEALEVAHVLRNSKSDSENRRGRPGHDGKKSKQSLREGR